MKREWKEAIELPVRWEMPSPFEKNPWWRIFDARQRLVCKCATKDDAEAIVTSLNSYKRMRTALEIISRGPSIHYATDVAKTALAQEQR